VSIGWATRILNQQCDISSPIAAKKSKQKLITRLATDFLAWFSALAESISDSLPNVRAVIDGEICSLDRRGRPQFKNLLFRRGNPPCFFAFDLLTYGFLSSAALFRAIW